MPRIVSKLLLSMLVVPLAALVFALTAALLEVLVGWREPPTFAVAGVIMWLVLAAYWLALWRSSVLWTRRRVYRTIDSAVFCAGIGAAFGYFMSHVWGHALVVPIGAGGSAFGWLGWTAIIWQQTRAEEAAGKSAGRVICPTCGYSLSGLRTTTCPECGASPTLEALLNGQPGQEARALGNQANSVEPG